MSAGLAFMLGGIAMFALELALGALVAWKILRRQRADDDRFWKSNTARGDRDDA